MNESVSWLEKTKDYFFSDIISLENFWGVIMKFAPKCIKALLIFAIGWWLSGIVANLIVKAMSRSKVDASIRTFLQSIIKTLCKVVVIIMVLAAIGMDVTTLVAAIGTLGVTVGLALKDSLSNFASGLLILFNRTFKVGDFIEIGGNTGTVKRIELMFTTLATADNKRLVIPNSVVTSSTIINYTAKSQRRMDLSVGVAYESDLKAVHTAITKALEKSEHVHMTPAPAIGIASFDDSAITFDVKVWVDTATFNDSKYWINENIFNELKAAGVEIPFNQLDIHVKKD